MPPANRHNPVRVKSSDSQYSYTEFMQEFPDDAACLEHLWRSRYSPDGTHAECPKCERERVHLNTPAARTLRLLRRITKLRH